MIKAILSFIGNNGPLPTTQNADHLSGLPPELLAVIFNKLPFGQSHLNFSLVNRKLCHIAAENMSPIDNLVAKTNKLIPFSQENRIHTFLVRDMPENKTETVITGDSEEYAMDPMVTIWENGKLPINEGHRIETFFNSFFYKPIFFLEMGGPSANYVAAAQYNSDGLIQIWDIEKKIKLVQKELGKEISFFCPENDQLFIGFFDGEVRAYRFSDLSLIKSWQADTEEIRKIFIDSSTKRIFTISSAGLLKIWDAEKLNCIKSVEGLNDRDAAYDPASKFLFCAEKNPLNSRSIKLLDSKNGTEIASFTEPDETASLMAIHYNAESSLLFASFSSKIDDLARGKITVWDVNTKQMVQSFLTLTTPLPEPGLCDWVFHIDYDPKSRVILTGGSTVSLWDLDGGCLLKNLPFPEDGLVNKMVWNKEAQKLYVLQNSRLHLLDYSN